MPTTTEVVTLQRQRRKSKRPLSPKAKREFPVRYQYSSYRRIKSSIVGRFKDLWPLYKDKYEFYCADVLPERILYADGNWQYTGMKLDARHIQKYGLHRCWLDPTVKKDGKAVMLVFNAE